VLTFVTEKTIDDKKRVVFILDPDDINLMVKKGKPIVVDLTMSHKLGLPMVLVAGYTPDEEMLKIELKRQRSLKNNKIGAQQLMEALETCKNLKPKKEQ